MRNRDPDQQPGKPHARIKKAANKPPLLQRMRFWLWRLKNKK
jgi:hypothetical protein